MLNRRPCLGALLLIVGAACDDAIDANRRGQEVEAEPDDSADVETDYYAADDRDLGPAKLRLVAELDLQNRRDLRVAAETQRRSPMAWLSEIQVHLKDTTLVVVAEFLEDRGAKYGEYTQTALVAVASQFAGPTLETDSIEVVQAGLLGEPLSCGGLPWKTGMRFALVLNPMQETGAYRILQEVSPHAVGWAIEISPNHFESYGDVEVDLQALTALGGAQ